CDPYLLPFGVVGSLRCRYLHVLETFLCNPFRRENATVTGPVCVGFAKNVAPFTVAMLKKNRRKVENVYATTAQLVVKSMQKWSDIFPGVKLRHDLFGVNRGLRRNWHEQ